MGCKGRFLKIMGARAISKNGLMVSLKGNKSIQRLKDGHGIRGCARSWAGEGRGFEAEGLQPCGDFG